jgi:uncharacterized protein (DUF2267 family)
MSDFLSQISSSAGISSSQAKDGLGALLNHFKSKIPSDQFNQVQSAIPGASDMMESAKKAISGGFMGMIMKIFGGGSLLSVLIKLGLTPEKLITFLPAVIRFLKTVVPPELLKKLLQTLPANLPGLTPLMDSKE